MSYKKAFEHYEKTMHATVSPIEYVLRLFEQLSYGYHQLEREIEEDAPILTVNDTLHKLQLIFFELMATVDRTNEKGAKLFTTYLYLNQRIVDMRLTRQFDQLEEIKEETKELQRAWKDALQKSRKRNFTSNQI